MANISTPSPSKPKRIFISAGESSGYRLAIEFINHLRNLDNNIVLEGMGDETLRNAGVDILMNPDGLAIIGAVEVIKVISKVRSLLKQFKEYVTTNPPDLVVLIDLPGVNMRFAKIAKAAGVKVLYYVSPSIWAYHYGRIKHIKRDVDHMAVLFPFEVDIYQKEKVPVTFAGHPMVSAVKPTDTPQAICKQYGLDANKPIIGILPGSRHSEIKNLLPIMNEVVPLIKQQIPDAQFILPLAKNLELKDLSQYKIDQYTIATNDTYNVLSICDAAITASGTATLEVALTQTPQAIIYKVNWITASIVTLAFIIAYHRTKNRNIGLCNIIARKTIAREFVQLNARPKRIAKEIIRLLKNQPYRDSNLAELKTLSSKLGTGNESINVAHTALSMLDSNE